VTAFQLAPILLGLLVLLPVALLSRRASSDPTRAALRSLGTAKDLHALTPTGALASARRLRSGLPERAEAAETGLALGALRPRGPVLRASWEDVLVAVMAPRSGKTTSLAVPAVLDAPGPVVATSNKADLWAATAALRAEVGRVWTFDPQSIARAPRSWWWDPVRELVDVESAERLASHFVLTVDDDRSRDIWGPAAQELLAALLMAARCAGRDLLAVYSWLSDERAPEPVSVLRDAGLHALADSLAGVQGSPAETRGSVFFTARTAARCLRDPNITAWVTPPAGEGSGSDGPTAGLERFDPAAFVQSTGALYLLSKDGGGSASPLVAALTDRVLREATLAAERAGGRLDPPLVAVLDEAANVCRIADLPQLYSHLGSRGIVPLTLLQSYPQARSVWGEAGAKTLWSAATVKLLGAGIDDAAFAEDVSRLVGDHDVPTRSKTSGGGKHGQSTTTSVRRDRILSPAQIRALPKGSALLLATGAKPALLRLLPWYAGPRASAVEAASSVAVAGIASSAARGGGEAA
jgi:type IV secretory pathway TraG/TraD family ATPase VirD4